MARCVPFASRSCSGFTSAARVTRRPNGFTFFAKMATRSLRADGGSEAVAPAELEVSPLAASATTIASPATIRVERIRSGVDRHRRAEGQLLGQHGDGGVVHADAAVGHVLAQHGGVVVAVDADLGVAARE